MATNLSIDTILISTRMWDVERREIYLHGYITNTEEDPGVEYRMATNFYKNIRMLDAISNNPILVHMHSVGGNWHDGMVIYDAIRLCRISHHDCYLRPSRINE